MYVHYQLLLFLIGREDTIKNLLGIFLGDKLCFFENLQINSPSKEESNKNLGDADYVVERGAGLDNFSFHGFDCSLPEDQLQ